MKNIAKYNECSFEFHKEVVRSKKNSKSNPQYKEQVMSLNDSIQKQFALFENKFTSNEIETLNNLSFPSDDKKNLLRLYSYKSKPIQKLKIKLTTDKDNKVSNTCQNCTIGEINSFDHFIPKDEFPEFVVNPKNLIPCCTTCNSFKSTIWRNGNERTFLNLYLDMLPSVQYLFVDLDIQDDSLNLNYNILNIHNIEQNIFKLIEAHYDKLHLLMRFKENSDNVISELEGSINNHLDVLSLQQIISIITKDIVGEKSLYGNNYWKSILKETLLNNVDYMNRFEK